MKERKKISKKKKQSGALNQLLTPPSHIHKKDDTGVNLIVRRAVLLSFRCRDHGKKKKEHKCLSDVCRTAHFQKYLSSFFFDFLILFVHDRNRKKQR
jgi:hypothetical protein